MEGESYRGVQPQVYLTFRREKHWLCSGGKADWWHKEKDSWFTLLPIQERPVSCRIPTYTYAMERISPVRCDLQKTSGKTRRTTNIVYHGTLLLPDICYQSSTGGSQYLVFLQRQGFYRNSYQRTETRLHFDKNTYKQIYCKPSVFFFTSVCLQYSQLVQTSLFTETITECDIRNYSYRYSSSASKINQQRTSEYSQITKRIYFYPDAELHYAENRKFKEQINFVDLQNFQNSVPS